VKVVPGEERERERDAQASIKSVSGQTLEEFVLSAGRGGGGGGGFLKKKKKRG